MRKAKFRVLITVEAEIEVSDERYNLEEDKFHSEDVLIEALHERLEAEVAADPINWIAENEPNDNPFKATQVVTYAIR